MNTTIVTTIENLLATGRIVEAKTLLISEELSHSSEELRGYTSEIERRLAQAEALVTQATAMEREGRVDEAKALYESVLPVAADFPGVAEHINRMDEALQLTRAVQRRGKRLRRSQFAKSGSRRSSEKKRMLRAVLGASVAAVAVLLAMTMPWPPSPEPEKMPSEETVPPAVSAPSAPTAPSTPTAPPAPTALATPAAQDQPSDSDGSRPPATATVQSEAYQPPIEPDTASAPNPLLPPQEKLPATTDTPPPPQPHATAAEHPVPEAAPQAPVSLLTGEQPAELFYTVRRADSLSSIAKNELCNETAWRHIYRLNRDRIVIADQVAPGMILRLTGLENRCPPPPQPASQSGNSGAPAPAKKGKEKKTNR